VASNYYHYLEDITKPSQSAGSNDEFYESLLVLIYIQPIPGCDIIDIRRSRIYKFKLFESDYLVWINGCGTFWSFPLVICYQLFDSSDENQVL